MKFKGSVYSSARNYFKRNFPGLLWTVNIYTNFKYRKKSLSSVFNSIYLSNSWGNIESRSGEGSAKKQAASLIESIPKIFKKYHVKTVLDAPCGDFNWMQHVDLRDIKYIGADIVSELVDRNRTLYQKEQTSFKVLDLTKDPLDKVDLIIVRDCFVHLSFEKIHLALSNIRHSGVRYILTTSFVDHQTNRDIASGGWRKLNFEKPPFNFPGPLDFIDEQCEEGDHYVDKMLVLWDIESLNISAL